MKTILRITEKDERPFTGDAGEEIEYYWYRAERIADGVEIRFGSTDGSHQIGKEIELDLRKREKVGRGGKPEYQYTENVESEK